jgi:hypothetical protein
MGKKPFIALLAISLLLGNGGLVFGEGQSLTFAGDHLRKAFTPGTDSVYLESSVKGWSPSETYKFTYAASETIPYKLLGVAMAADEEFKLYVGTDWAGVNCTNDATALHFTTASASDAYANFKTVDAGTYDFYFTSNYQSTGAWKVFAIRSAATLLAEQDLNFTRTTQINASDAYFSEVTSHNYFSCITKNRTTEFIDEGLYMHVTDDQYTNSGYYTRKNENGGVNMYHYALEALDNRLLESASITGERLDSASQDTNGFFINGHYFHDRASVIGALMSYDFNNFNYFLVNNAANAAYITNWMHFTAPLFTNPQEALITFTGAGLKDTGAGVSYYLYSDEATKLTSTAGTVFSQADLSAIGSTAIAFLPKYINQTI